jgi:ABC-type transporter Mla subunit MlaD
MIPDLSDEALDALLKSLEVMSQGDASAAAAAIRGLRERLVNAHASLEHLMAYHAACHGGTEDQLRERAERAEAEADRTADAFTSLHETHQRVAIERDRLRAALEKVSGTDPDDAAGCGSIARRALEGK